MALAVLGGCVERPAVIASATAADGKLVARLVRSDAGTILDIGLADAGPYTTIAELAGWSQPFQLTWRGSTVLAARLPCATTTVHGALEQEIRLPDTTGPINLRLTRPAACKLPLLRAG